MIWKLTKKKQAKKSSQEQDSSKKEESKKKDEYDYLNFNYNSTDYLSYNYWDSSATSEKKKEVNCEFVDLTKDHRPDMEEEAKRVEERGLAKIEAFYVGTGTIFLRWHG